MVTISTADAKTPCASDAMQEPIFVWLWLVVNDRKFPVGTVFFSHTNQPAVLLHEPATIRTNQPNRLQVILVVEPEFKTWVFLLPYHKENPNP